jgi:malonyl-CoA decarboxylase
LSLLADLLSTLIDRRLPVLGGARSDGRSIEALCRDLTGNLGEVTGYAMAHQILDRYEAMDDIKKRAFFLFLNNEMDIDTAAVIAATTSYAADASVTNFHHLMEAVEAPRQELARRLNQVPGATGRIVAMRNERSQSWQNWTRICGICFRAGSTAAFWCCARSIGKVRLMC